MGDKTSLAACSKSLQFKKLEMDLLLVFMGGKQESHLRFQVASMRWERQKSLVSLSSRNHIYAGTLPVENHGAFSKGKQGIILCPANIATGVETSATLADNDATHGNKTTTIYLDAKALAVGLATVLN
jgi:hypothetical protein